MQRGAPSLPRCGYHGRSQNGDGENTVGRWGRADRWIMARFDHHTSRCNDPQLHSHVTLLNKVLTTDEDGSRHWRTLDSRRIHKVRGEIGATYDAVFENTLMRSLGVTVEERPDGMGNCIAGVSPEVCDLYSQRRSQVQERAAKYREAYRQAHGGREPDRLARMKIALTATLDSRPPKAKELIDWDALDRLWRDRAVQAGIDLDDVQSSALAAGQAATVTAVPELDREQITRDALAAVQEKRAEWGRTDLRKEILSRIPRHPDWTPEQVMAVAAELTAAAVSPRAGLVVPTDPPRLLDEPAELLTAEGRSRWAGPPESERYTLAAHLDAEARILAAAQDANGPRVAERRVAAALAQAPKTLGHPLGADQAAAVRQVLTSGRRVEAIVAPAGTGKTTALRVAVDAWSAQGGRVLGMATSEQATRVLVAATGVRGANLENWLKGYDRRHDRADKIKEVEAKERAARDRVDEVRRKVAESEQLRRRARSWPEPTRARIEAQHERLLARQERFRGGHEKLSGWLERLRAEHEFYSLRPGQLVIVDEAGTAATRHLTRLAEEGVRVDAKLLLVGDPHQVQSVEPGGMLELVTHDAPEAVAELHEVRRFRNADGTVREWEAEASLRLREWDPAAITALDERGRVHTGTREQVQAQAVRNWFADTVDGRDALLITATNERATELAGAARDLLVAAGRVQPEGVRLRDGTHAGVGDVVQARHPDRRIRTADGSLFVANRDMLRVTERHADGSLRVVHTEVTDRSGAPAAYLLPAGYVRHHVALSYAVTIDGCQGATAYSGHVLPEGMTREQLYPALTRGWADNRLYLSTERPAVEVDRPDPLPATDLERDAAEVIAEVLGRSSRQVTAVETIRQRWDFAESLTRTHPEWSWYVAEHARSRYLGILEQTMPPGEYARLRDDPALPALLRVTQQAEAAGRDPARLLTQAARLRDFTDARSVAEVMHHRVDRLAGDTAEVAAARSFLERTPDIDGAPGAYLRRLAEQMDNRVWTLGERTAEQPPEWAAQLGPLPVDPAERDAWVQRAGRVAAYRELHGHDGPDAIGPAPGVGRGEARQAWQAAAKALAWTDPQVSYRSMSDEQLHTLIHAYRAEQDQAPEPVADRLQAAGLAVRDYRSDAALARLEASLADTDTAREAARARAGELDRLVEVMERHTGEELETAHAERLAWYDRTRDVREAAARAHAELLRRHPEAEQAERSPHEQLTLDTDRQPDREREQVTERDVEQATEAEQAAEEGREPPEAGALLDHDQDVERGQEAPVPEPVAAEVELERVAETAAEWVVDEHDQELQEQRPAVRDQKPGRAAEPEIQLLPVGQTERGFDREEDHVEKEIDQAPAREIDGQTELELDLPEPKPVRPVQGSHERREHEQQVTAAAREEPQHSPAVIEAMAAAKAAGVARQAERAAETGRHVEQQIQAQDQAQAVEVAQAQAQAPQLSR